MTEHAVDPMNGTGEALIEFLDTTWKRGLLTHANANAIKVGVREVLLHVEGEDWESKDVRTLDVDDVVRRFETKRATNYTPGSLRTYRHRFMRAMAMYRGFLQDPGGWRPTGQPRSSAPRRRATGQPEVKVTLPAAAPSPPADEEPHERPDMMTFPFPIRRAGVTLYARLILPHDLTMAEAETIGRHIKTLAIQDPPAKPPAGHAPDPDPGPEPTRDEPPS